jgi:multidrug efflux pump subunit AcrB
MFSFLRIVLVSFLLASCANSQNSMSKVVVVETVVASKDAHEIERLVTAPLERAVNALAGVMEIRSRSAPGSSRIEVLCAGTPTPQALKQVESAVVEEWAKFSTLASKPVVAINSSTLL